MAENLDDRPPMPRAPCSVLFVRTGNFCRSIMAEALPAHHGENHVSAHSAGSRPAGYVYPTAMPVLSERSIDASQARRKSRDEFAARPFDAVLTVCDAAADEACPRHSSPAVHMHWGVPAPAAFVGNDETVLDFFRTACNRLEQRAHALLELPLKALDPAAFRQHLAAIGQQVPSAPPIMRLSAAS